MFFFKAEVHLLGMSASSQYVFSSSSFKPASFLVFLDASLCKCNVTTPLLLLAPCPLTFASVLAAALTAVYSRRAKNTKKMHTPVHRSTAWRRSSSDGNFGILR